MLLSPIQEITEVSCLRYLQSSTYVDFVMFKYNVQMTEAIMSISLDGGQRSWHLIDVTLPPGTYGIAFQFLYGGDGGAAIDNVTLTAGSCEQCEFGVHNISVLNV